MEDESDEDESDEDDDDEDEDDLELFFVGLATGLELERELDFRAGFISEQPWKLRADSPPR